MKRAFAVVAALAVLPALAAPAAASERMQLACHDGRVIERSNGSSWSDVDHAAGYVSRHLLITADNEVVYEKGYGTKSGGQPSTCVGERFGSIWTVQLVRTH